VNREQLKAVLWLRSRLTRNQWRRGGQLGAILAGLIIVAASIVATVLFVGATLAGAFLFGERPSIFILIAWDIVIGAFLVSWMIGLLAELQRSELIDLQRLMHLPVSLGQIFVINYIASHFVFSIVVSVPLMLGLSLGLAISRSPAMLLLIPVSLAVVFMITAWTYCLRGWLAAMMSNPRRRRSIIVGITVAFVLIAQAPNFYFNVIARTGREPVKEGQSREQARKERHEAREQRNEEMLNTYLYVHRFVPPLWAPLAARSIAEQRIWPSLLAMAGCVVIGAIGLRRAYTTTVRFYRGDTRSKPAIAPLKAQEAVSESTSQKKTLLVERRIPCVPDEAAGVGFATFRSMLRAPEVKMMWATSVMVTVIFAASTLFRAGSNVPAEARPFIVTGLLAMLLFMMVQVLGNHFGFDRGGFRAFVLAPINRRHLLLGKNLANVPVIGLITGAVAIAATLWLKLPWDAAFAIPFQFLTMFLLASSLGNLLSILVPYRVQQGSMKPTKMPAKAMLMMFLTHMLFPIVMAPAFMPPLAQLLWNLAKLPPVPIGLLLSLICAAAAAVGYWFSLAPLGRLLQQREQKILDVLASEVE
jgi:ABC-2 type transport system permease protein